MIGITVGAGLKRPQGAFVPLDPSLGLVEAVAQMLRKQPALEERWWSPYRWERAYRTKTGWQSSIGAPVDVDWHNSSTPPTEVVAGLEHFARNGAIAGSIFHLTPHGCRVVFVLDQECTDRNAMMAACLGAGELVRQSLEQVGLGDTYKVDLPLLGDLGRLFFVPTCVAKKQRRQAEVVVMKPQPYRIDELKAALPRSTEDLAWTDETPTRPEATSPPRPPIDEAIARWNAEHPAKWPRSNGKCPVCHDDGCFGHLPEHPGRWACFSTDHPASIGVRGPTCMHGDALDLEAHRRGVKPIDVLRKDGYLRQRPTPLPARGTEMIVATAEPPAGLGRRPYRPNSLSTAVAIIQNDERCVLSGRRLEYDEMQRAATLDRVRLQDTDVRNIRLEIEERFSGGVDKNGNQIGLKMSMNEVESAVDIVAHRRSFHPVREYLRSLIWDGRERLSHLPEVITCEASQLNLTLLLKWFVSAAARPLRPGCKVDTALILQGEQGTLKSSFFRVLGGDWFSDTSMDIRSKDALMALEGAWIVEWAELTAMNKADPNTVKGFLTSAVDIYRRPYERTACRVERTSIIVGTTNPDEFLDDETGERRFWPIKVNGIDLAALREWRDQLWAEAVVLLEAGTKWELTDEEKILLSAAHAQHTVSDEWAPIVLSYSKDRRDLTIGAILRDAIQKPIGQWTKADEMRVAKILVRAGWKKEKRGGGVRVWVQPEAKV